MATVRRVQTRAEGSWETSEAVVQANQRAEASVATETSVAAALRWSIRYSTQTAIGSSPLTIDGVERAQTWIAISRR